MTTDLESSAANARGRGAPVYAEIELSEVWRELWEARWLLLATAVICALLGAVATFILPRYYEARTTLLPVEQSALSDALGSLGNLGALASLAGVNFGGAEDQSIEAMALLTSRQFTLDFIRDHGLFPVMFARKWDATRGDWKVSGDKVPTDGDAYKLFDRKVRRISQDKKTGVISLTVRWKDPQLATALANDLVVRLNQVMQARAVAESEAVIRQLELQLAQTDVVPLRQALSEVLESEVKHKTLAVVRDEFAMRVVDPAMAPAVREYVSPRRLNFIGGGAILGLVLGGLFITARRLLRTAR